MEIAADYEKESSLPLDRDAARLIAAAPELLDMVRELSKATNHRLLRARAEELLARVDNG